MDFKDLVEQEHKAERDRLASVEKHRAEYREALERWNAGVLDFIKLSLPTVPFGWVSTYEKRVGIFGGRTETWYRYNPLGEGWVLRPYCPNDRERDGQNVIFLAKNCDLYGDIFSPGLQDGAPPLRYVGAPAGIHCALRTNRYEEPLSKPPSRPNEMLKLLAKYAAEHS